MNFDNIQYNVTYCIADMKMIDFLLENIPDFYKHLIARHHKFVESYVQYKGSIRMVAAVHGFTEQDIHRIFWRIQKKLLNSFIELIYKETIKIKDIPANFDAFLFWQLEQFREDAELVYTFIKNKMNYTFHIDGVSEKRRDQVTTVLDVLTTVHDLENVLPENVYPIAKDLLNGIALTKVVEKYKKNLNYIVTSIIGRNNPRSAAERGWLAYLDEEPVSIKKEEKVIQFPLR